MCNTRVEGIDSSMIYIEIDRKYISYISWKYIPTKVAPLEQNEVHKVNKLNI